MATDLNNLSPSIGAKRKRKRLGRGNASGLGTTAGRGQKGQKSREGNNIPSWFEGGQMPLQRRLPKRGFTSTRKIDPVAVNLRDLPTEGVAVIDPAWLIEHGRIPRNTRILKILGEGELAGAVTIKAHRFSKSARAKIEAAGGTAEEL